MADELVKKRITEYTTEVTADDLDNSDVIFVDSTQHGTRKLRLKGIRDIISGIQNESIKSSGVSVTADNYATTITNVNDQPVNTIYAYAASLQLSVTNLPSNNALNIMHYTYKYSVATNVGQVQIAIERSGENPAMYFRTTGGTPVTWGSWVKLANNADIEAIREELDNLDIETDTTLSISGKPADAKATGDAIDDLKADLNSKITKIDNTAPSEYSYLLANIAGETAYNVAVSQGWTDLPGGGTFGGVLYNHQFANNFDEQTFISLSNGDMYNRIVRRESRNIYRDWKPVWDSAAVDTLSGRIDTVSSDLQAKTTKIDNTVPSEYSYLLSNIAGETAYNVATSQGWTDMPTDLMGVLFNHQFANNFDIQTFIAMSVADGTMYSRIVRRQNRAIFRDWRPVFKAEEDPVLSLKVVVLGDSICRGGRNSDKGFIGDVGCPYVNIAVGGATISTKHDSSQSTDSLHPMGALNIPDMLVKYSEQTGADWYVNPDVIIAEGGINDYLKDAPLGTIPTQVVDNDTDAEALDQSTLTGGLQYLFYQMINLYPDAKRYFLITNRVTTYPWTVNMPNGYTQTEMHDAIVAVCKMYGVIVIDVFNESFINTAFPYYVSPTRYRDDPSVTNLYHVDKDALHPMALGYRTGYAPLVKHALRKAVNL